MCRDPVGRAILEDLCDMQLAYRVHDVLVVHTNPTQEIIDLILEKGVDGLNREWQSKLRSILIDGDTSVRDDLSTLASVMLATNNRYNFTDSQSAEALRNSGINFIVHGHSYNLRRFTPQVV